MNKIIISALVLLIVFVNSNAQSDFWNSRNAYLGQTPPNDTPKIFAAKLLVPDSGIAMDRSAFSADAHKIQVFVNNDSKSSLVVKPLNNYTTGKIGFWVGNNSDDDFSNLIIQNK
jgi:hypothetical protein